MSEAVKFACQTSCRVKMPSLVVKDDEAVQRWKSEYMLPCSFCARSKSVEPHLVLVSLELGNVNLSICEICLKGANSAAARAYRGLSKPTKPSSPYDAKRKRTFKNK